MGSGETEPATKGLGEPKPTIKGSGETKPAALRSGETEPATKGLGEPLSKCGSAAPRKTVRVIVKCNCLGYESENACGCLSTW